MLEVLKIYLYYKRVFFFLFQMSVGGDLTSAIMAFAQSDEQPSTSTPQCILQCGEACTDNDSIDRWTIERWKRLEEKALDWKGLDKFGDVYEDTDWKSGPIGKYIHDKCRFNMFTKQKLAQAQTRKRKHDDSSQSMSESVLEETCASVYSSPKKLRSHTGTVHEKERCVWCMQGSSKRQDHKNNLILLQTKDAWLKFKCHTVNVKDPVIRSRLNTLISTISDFHAAIGMEIRYHRKCYLENITNAEQMNDENSQHLQNVNLREAQSIFFLHVKKVIFDDHEFRTLQNLLSDYNRIVSNHGFNTVVRSSYLKELMIREFGDDIGFYERTQRNVSELVYDKKAAGTYVEAALLSLGISDEQLLKNIASRIRTDIR